MLSWDHRHLLNRLFDHRPLPQDSLALLEPGNPEGEVLGSRPRPAGRQARASAPGGPRSWRRASMPYRPGDVRRASSAVAAQRAPDTITKPPSDTSRSASGNPFLGAQPYRSENSHLFFGREEMTLRLANYILAHACITLFGESGVGKSSLMQAGVIPLLEKDYGFRSVRVDAWLTTKTPLEQLVQALFTSLKLGSAPTSR